MIASTRRYGMGAALALEHPVAIDRVIVMGNAGTDSRRRFRN